MKIVSNINDCFKDLNGFIVDKRQKTNELIIEIAIFNSNLKFNNKYKIIFNDFKDKFSKIILICPIHGEIECTYRAHIRSVTGCHKCSGHRLSNSEIIEKLKLLYKEYPYNFDHIKCTKDRDIVNPYCIKHKIYWNVELRYLYEGSGCLKCKSETLHNLKIFSQDIFNKKANTIWHNQFEYEKYNGLKSKINIKCKECNQISNVSAKKHLKGRKGCDNCHIEKQISYIEKRWIKLFNIPEEFQRFRIKLNDKIYYADGFDPLTNTIYEFYGDYFHGNPKIYLPEKTNDLNKINLGTLYNKTIERENILKTKYNLITIWEADYKLYIKNGGYILNYCNIIQKLGT